MYGYVYVRTYIRVDPKIFKSIIDRFFFKLLLFFCCFFFLDRSGESTFQFKFANGKSGEKFKFSQPIKRRTQKLLRNSLVFQKSGRERFYRKFEYFYRLTVVIIATLIEKCSHRINETNKSIDKVFEVVLIHPNVSAAYVTNYYIFFMYICIFMMCGAMAFVYM